MASESLYRGFTPDGRILVEIDWVEAPGITPGFLGRVILDGKYVLEEKKTTDENELIAWARKQMKDACRRSGGPERPN